MSILQNQIPDDETEWARRDNAMLKELAHLIHRVQLGIATNKMRVTAEHSQIVDLTVRSASYVLSHYLDLIRKR